MHLCAEAARRGRMADLSLSRSICHSDRLEWCPHGCGAGPSAPRLVNPPVGMVSRSIGSSQHGRNLAA